MSRIQIESGHLLRVPNLQGFTRPEGLDPRELLDSAFNLTHDDPLEVKIRFSADQARYIRERKWAKEQSIIEQADGSIILEMNTSGRWEIKRWVLSFGGEAELLEPAELRKEIAEELRNSLARYGEEAMREGAATG